MSIEAMKQALEALERYSGVDQRACDAEDALRQAIEQAEKQEPKCVVILEVFGKDWRLDYMSLPVGKHKLYTQQYVYTTPPAAQQEPTPWRDMVVVSLVREGIDKHKARELADHFAAQRQWVGLTDEEVQFYIKKHSKLVNAGYDKVTDTNLVAKTFDSTGFYKEVSTVLKERNT